VRYLNVKSDDAALKTMLELSGGRRSVPVIVDGDKIEIGYGGT
jgi:hypothetical protein